MICVTDCYCRECRLVPNWIASYSPLAVEPSQGFILLWVVRSAQHNTVTLHHFLVSLLRVRMPCGWENPRNCRLWLAQGVYRKQIKAVMTFQRDSANDRRVWILLWAVVEESTFLVAPVYGKKLSCRWFVNKRTNQFLRWTLSLMEARKPPYPIVNALYWNVKQTVFMVSGASDCLASCLITN